MYDFQLTFQQLVFVTYGKVVFFTISYIGAYDQLTKQSTNKPKPIGYLFAMPRKCCHAWYHMYCSYCTHERSSNNGR